MNINIYNEFMSELNHNRMPAGLLIDLEPGVYAAFYKGEIFVVAEPIKGSYAICEEHPTLQEYIESITDEDVESVDTIQIPMQGNIYINKGGHI